jgi:hypothetical protein
VNDHSFAFVTGQAALPQSGEAVEQLLAYYLSMIGVWLTEYVPVIYLVFGALG